MRAIQNFANAQLLKFAQDSPQDFAQAQPDVTKFKTPSGLTSSQAKKFKAALKVAQQQKGPTKKVLLTKRVSPKTIKKRTLKLKRDIKRKPKKKKPVKVYDVFGKVKGKFIKINPKPLKKTDALNKGTFAVDKTTAATFKIKSVGKSKRPGKLLKGERGYFSKNKNKFRNVKIRKGKKFKLTNTFIEKRGKRIDTRGEKKGLSIRRLITRRQRPKRKITPAQRKVLLKNLKKARRKKKR